MTDGPDGPARAPFFGDVPRDVLGLLVVICAVSIAILIGPIGVQSWLLRACSVWIGSRAAPFDQPLGPLAPYVLHVFAHGGWFHLLANAAGILAFGSAVARRFRSPVVFVAFFFVCALAGAVAEALFQPAETTMLGASSGAFGLIAGATYLIRARGGPPVRLLSRDMAVGLAPWVAVNVVFGVFGMSFAGAQVAWIAHLGGLFAGALLFPLFDRFAAVGGAARR